MKNQLEIITSFCKDSQYYLVKYNNNGKGEFGKIIENKELSKIDLSKHEIQRSIDYKNGDRMFVFDLKTFDLEITENPLELLFKNLECAKIIETVYPNIFNWVFDGISIKAYARVPSGNLDIVPTIGRYGGTDMFIRIIKQHLENIKNMSKGLTPDYNFLKNKLPILETELSIGSINLFNNMYSININLEDDYTTILKNSKKGKTDIIELNTLDIKYWTREINPDFIQEAKHIKLKNTIDLNLKYDEVYPPCILNLMKLKEKTNPIRFLLAIYLLSAHTHKDAKFVYDSVLSKEMREHANRENHFGYIRNNIKNYSCPTCSVLSSYCDKKCKYTHPLEKVQKIIEENDSSKTPN